MTPTGMDEKFKLAAEVICRQGMVQFPVSETAIAIVKAVVGENEEELDLIYAFREKPSQTADQLVESSGCAADKVEELAGSLAGKGLIFNQPSSAGIMIYRLLPLMLVGVMEYKFMVPLTGSAEEKELARLFEKLLAELRELNGPYDNSSNEFRWEVERWRPVVDMYFPEDRVDWALRIMECESGGDPNAKNPRSSASGLFQHLARLWPARAEAAGFADSDVFDPFANIAVAAVNRRARRGAAPPSVLPEPMI